MYGITPAQGRIRESSGQISHSSPQLTPAQAGSPFGYRFVSLQSLSTFSRLGVINDRDHPLTKGSHHLPISTEPPFALMDSNETRLTRIVQTSVSFPQANDYNPASSETVLIDVLTIQSPFPYEVILM